MRRSTPLSEGGGSNKVPVPVKNAIHFSSIRPVIRLRQPVAGIHLNVLNVRSAAVAASHMPTPNDSFLPKLTLAIKAPIQSRPRATLTIASKMLGAQ